MPSKSRRSKAIRAEEPFMLWWMPAVAMLTPLVFAAWEAVSADGGALKDAGIALIWPGVLLYFGTVALLWAGWKLDLE